MDLRDEALVLGKGSQNVISYSFIDPKHDYICTKK